MSTEEILTVSTVNQSLFDTQGSPALEDYFNDKSIKGMCFSYRQISHTMIYRGQTMWLLIIITVLGKRGEGIQFSIINGVLKCREVRLLVEFFFDFSLRAAGVSCNILAECKTSSHVPNPKELPQNFVLYCIFVLGEKLVPGAREVLTEIFKSCVHSEQMLSLTPTKPIKVADIYLSKEQINSQTPGNLLHVFFTNVRPPKKVLEDQLTQVVLWKLFSVCFFFFV